MKMSLSIRDSDPRLFSLLVNDSRTYIANLDLIAALSYPTNLVLGAMSMTQPNRASEGNLGQRYLGTGGSIDEIEALAIDRARRVFGFDYANIQPVSGTSAVFAALRAVCSPGDTVLSMDLAHGGHLSHGSPLSVTSDLYRPTYYSVDPESERIDLNVVEDAIRFQRPRVIVAGSSSYPRMIDYLKMAELARLHDAFLLVDASHQAGQIVAGLQSLPIQDHVIVALTTEKTLCGPRGGLVLCQSPLKKDLEQAVFPRFQGSFSLASIAGKAAILGEASDSIYRAFQRQICANAKALANGLMDMGLRLVTDGTDCHMVVADLRDVGVTGREAESVLLDGGIFSNRQIVPNDPLPARVASGLRLGTTCLTIQGADEVQCAHLGRSIGNLITSKGQYGKCHRELETLRVGILQGRCHRLFSWIESWNIE